MPELLTDVSKKSLSILAAGMALGNSPRRGGVAQALLMFYRHIGDRTKKAREFGPTSNLHDEIAGGVKRNGSVILDPRNQAKKNERHAEACRSCL